MTQLALNLGGGRTTVDITGTIVAGWTGRDKAAVERHIDELADLGVPRPSRTPLFYRVSSSRVTTDSTIESTAASSGEVEPVLLRHAGRLWVGVGSDHTDRELESHSVAMSKQLCDKPLATHLWPYDDLIEHWDQIILRSWITDDSAESLYQEGTLASLLHPDELLADLGGNLENGWIIFCGTLPAIGGIRPGLGFRYELSDPTSARRIAGGYSIAVLPLIS